MKALHEKWLEVYPHASWKEVITALKECEEKIEIVEVTGFRDIVVIPSSTNSGLIRVVKGKLKDILRTHSDILATAISTGLYRVTDALYANALITIDTKESMQTASGDTDSIKSSKLVTIIERHLESSLNPAKYLTNLCDVLENHDSVKHIATSILCEIKQDDSIYRIGYISCSIAREELKPGDHIHAHHEWFHTHHGIYIGEPDCDMIHFSGDKKGTSESKKSRHCQIGKTTLDEFRHGNRLCLVAYSCSDATKFSSLIHSSSSHTQKAMPLPETRKLAIHFLNHPKEWGTYEEWSKYDTSSEPSEVFACFCKTGLMNIAAQLQPTRWVPGSGSKVDPPCMTKKEALEKYRKMKRQKKSTEIILKN